MTSTAQAEVLSQDNEGGTPVLEVKNDEWRLRVLVGEWLQPKELYDLRRGCCVFDEDYSYSVQLLPTGGAGYAGLALPCVGVKHLKWTLAPGEDEDTLLLSGRLCFGPKGPTGLHIAHTFRFGRREPWIEEQISLSVPFGKDVYRLAKPRFAARKALYDRPGGRWVDGADTKKLIPLPFGRRVGQHVDHLLESYTASDLMPVGWRSTPLPGRVAEAWLWAGDAGGYLIAKYTQDHIEFSIADGDLYRPSGSRRDPDTEDAVANTNVYLRYMGAGFANGAPRGALTLEAGSAFTFGTTRVQGYDGSVREGRASYKRYLAAKGHAVPSSYAASVHWNELYNLGWRLGDNAPLQCREDVMREAQYARDAGATTFYFDPGWDKVEGNSEWDEERLGPLRDFVAELRDRYGLSLALHLMMHTKDLTEDRQVYRRRPDGEIDRWTGLYDGGYVCAASNAWQTMKTERLLRLAADGTKFFMFDFLNYDVDEMIGTSRGHETSPSGCWAPDHGHSVPCTLEEHCDGVMKVIRAVKRAYPDVVIEAHDRVAGGLNDYLPLYYEHGGLHSYDEIWGFEYMWDPYMDLLSGKALSLYEYNLTYDVPLYLHTNSRYDNEARLAFWWYASTCRHLGIGGVRPGDPLWSSLRSAMETYNRLKPFFVRGRFIGMDRMAHLHVLDGAGAAVLVAFNLGSSPSNVRLVLGPDELGTDRIEHVEGAKAELTAAGLHVELTIPPLSPALIEINTSLLAGVGS